MGMTTILGFFVTDDPAYLASWMDGARERYAALEQALEPLQNVVEYLDRDWQPQPPAYWHRTMEHLAPLRQAIEACSALFEREQSSEECPVPLAMVGHHLRYQISLSAVSREYEEAGILLTSHSAASYSLEVGHIRQRQQVLKALRKLCEVGQKAIKEGRAEIDTLPAEHQAYQSLGQSTRVKHRATAASIARKQTALQVLGQDGEMQPPSLEDEVPETSLEDGRE
jgi:hypothetical protein